MMFSKLHVSASGGKESSQGQQGSSKEREVQLADDWRGKLSPLEVARKKAMGSLQPGISKAG